MRIIADTKGQISAEMILILSGMSIIILITAYQTTDILNDITNHTQEVITAGRNKLLGKI